MKSISFDSILGIVSGAGQPKNTKELISSRHIGLSKIFEKSKLKSSSQNLEVKQIYSEYLEYPGSPIAKKLLHIKNFL